MKYKIVADSSCNLFELEHVDFTSVPLKIITNDKEYIDTKNLNIEQMLEDLKKYKGKTATSCPNTNEWLNAFGDANIIFGVTATSSLSNSFNEARMAKRLYEQQYPDRKVFILDSLSMGPELYLIIHKLAELMKSEKTYSEIRNAIMDYMQKTRLLFTSSHLNEANENDDTSKKSNLLKGHIVGRASYKGKLMPIKTCHGQKKSLKTLIAQMKDAGYNGGKIVIAHTQNESNALRLIELLKESFGNIHIELMKNAGLCSYYAKDGGILVGFEI